MIPEGIVDSLWYEVVERIFEFGDTFDTWQDGVGEVILSLREDGTFAATVGGVTISIPRQVAKTFIVGRIVIALATLYPDLTILWTAHRTRTATRTFQTLKGVCLRPTVKPHLKAGSNMGTAIRDANGEQAIPFANGSEILFGAREGGFGRGFDEVDVIVFDESQILTIRALEDMVAATLQSRFEFGALLLYMGTPPRPIDPGEAFEARRDEALAAKVAAGGTDFGPVVEAGDAVYVECSADPNVGQKGGPSLDDEHQIELANPSYPHRTPAISVKRLRKNLPSDEAWRREGLGVWDVRSGPGRVIPSSMWGALQAEAAPEDGRFGYGVRFRDDGVSLAVCLAPDAGPAHVEVVQQRPLSDGVDWLADWLYERRDKGAWVGIDGKDGSELLVKAMGEKARRYPSRRIHVLTVAQAIAANTSMLTAIRQSAVTHFNQPALNEAVAVAGKRPIGTAGGWGWLAIDDGDVRPLEAVTLAHWAALSSPRKRTGGRRVVVHG